MIAHEFIHIYAGHVGKEGKNFESIDIGDSGKLEVPIRSWFDEIMADQSALYITLEIMGEKGVGATIVVWGIELLFALMVAIDKWIAFVSVIDYKTMYHRQNTHPIPHLRAHSIRGQVTYDLKDKDHPIKDRNFANEIMNDLWERSFQRRIACIVTNIDIAPIWFRKIKGDNILKRDLIGMDDINLEDWLNMPLKDLN